MNSANKEKYYSTILASLGLLIVGYSIYIYIVAPNLTYEVHPSSENVRSYTLIRILAGIFYTAAIILIIKKRLLSTRNVVIIFAIGLIARIILVPSEPILEDDYNRYLWDGAVTANGYNPYEYAPKQFINVDSLQINEPQILYNLADSSGVIINRINHPHIRTIYPPVAQVIFGISYLINPWSVTIWKSILLVMDLIVFFLLVLVLKKLRITLVLVAIYWWNPILLHEIFNAGHMDLLMYPLFVGAILFYLKEKYVFCSSLIALSVGVKVWPIIIIPFILKKLWPEKNKLLLALIVIGIILLLQFVPILITKLDDSLGFVTYSKNWTNNESVFQIVNFIVKQCISIFNISYHCNLCVARWVTIFFFGSVIFYYLIKTDDVKYKFTSVSFMLVAIMFLISPTQFPWYYTWALPFLVFNPRLSFIAYAIFLPLYQLKYSIPFLVWVEHVPIILLFISELYSRKIRNCVSLKDN